MPNRPPGPWFERCTGDVRARGGAFDANAVCGAVWSRKSGAEKRETTRAEEGTTMAAKKKRKQKLHGAALAAHERRLGRGKGKRSKKKSGGHKKHHRRRSCAFCGHSAVHHAKQGCLHHAGMKFCSCKHRG
jgi:hypothetical protein